MPPAGLSAFAVANIAETMGGDADTAFVEQTLLNGWRSAKRGLFKTILDIAKGKKTLACLETFKQEHPETRCPRPPDPIKRLVGYRGQRVGEASHPGPTPGTSTTDGQHAGIRVDPGVLATWRLSADVGTDVCRC